MTKTNSLDQWNEVKEALRAALPEASFNTWISNLDVVKINTKEITLGAANLFVKTWIEKNYLQTISEAVRSILGCAPTINIKISAEKFREHRRSIKEEIESSIEELPTPNYRTKVSSPSVPLFSQSQHTLTSFVEIPQNSFAVSALKQALTSPGEYSPITIFADHGLGKTHLLHGLCNSFSTEHPEKKIICLTAQMFVQQCSASIMNNNKDAFIKRFNEADLLVIDDFHFMGQGKKIASQKELVDILDTLTSSKKQVVLSSSSPIHEITGINSMLASRISAGLQIRLDPLNAPAREKILSTLEPTLNNEQTRDIANRLCGDIREIEGILKTIRAMNKFAGKNASNSNIIESLTIAQKRSNFTVSEIIAAVSLEFNIPVSDIKGKKRTGDITKARRIAIHLSRHLTDISLTDIGKEFGGRKHPTIMNILKTTPADPTRLTMSRLENLVTTLGANITVSELMSTQKQIF